MQTHPTAFALITGATSGIGKAIAIQLARKRMDLFLTGRNEEALRQIAHRLSLVSQINVSYMAADLSKDSGVDAIWNTVNALEKEGRELTIMVNNAGIGAFGPSLEVTQERVDRMLEVNIRSLTRLSLLAADRMTKRGHGRILNIASTGGFQPTPYMNVYGATKAYVLHFTEGLAEELKHTGVSVTAYCPGPTHTHFGDRAGLKETSPFNAMSANVDNVAIQAVEAMYRGDPMDIHGWKNRLIAIFAQVCPRTWVRRIASNALRKMK